MKDTAFALSTTPKQIAYARSLALKNHILLSQEVQQDRRFLSAWIDAQAWMKPLSELTDCPLRNRSPSPNALPASSGAQAQKNAFRTRG
jgi:hypothetical protein